MRASRLLQILLMLQNRGRMTARALAAELEVVPRTILRDVDAMTEAGLPVIVHRGAHGGIELGFNYRSRLTGLADDEAEALAIWLAAPPPALAALGLTNAAGRARAKLVESFPDRSRAVMERAAVRFPRQEPDLTADPRISAVATAIREGLTLTLQARGPAPRAIVPTVLSCGPEGWTVLAPTLSAPVPLADWGDINLSRPPLATGGPPR